MIFRNLAEWVSLFANCATVIGVFFAFVAYFSYKKQLKDSYKQEIDVILGNISNAYAATISLDNYIQDSESPDQSVDSSRMNIILIEILKTLRSVEYFLDDKKNVNPIEYLNSYKIRDCLVDLLGKNFYLFAGATISPEILSNMMSGDIDGKEVGNEKSREFYEYLSRDFPYTITYIRYDSILK